MKTYVGSPTSTGSFMETVCAECGERVRLVQATDGEMPSLVPCGHEPSLIVRASGTNC